MIKLTLDSKKIIAFVDDEFEDLEHWYPVYRLREAGAQVDLVGPEKGGTYHGLYGIKAVADYSYDEIDPANYDGIVVPGGWAPDKIRRYPKALDIVRALDEAEKPIGHICHAGWVLVSADVLKGHNTTSTPAIKDDVTNAGATWHDEPVVVCGHIVSSRRPDDLPHYMREFIKLLNK